MSVRKPGVMRKAPPKITKTPSSTSRCGIRPACIVSWKRRHTARPCERMSHAPSNESATSSASVGRVPIRSPTFRITYSSAIGMRMKSAMSQAIGLFEVSSL
jgi:hypothetical protein